MKRIALFLIESAVLFFIVFFVSLLAPPKSFATACCSATDCPSGYSCQGAIGCPPNYGTCSPPANVHCGSSNPCPAGYYCSALDQTCKPYSTTTSCFPAGTKISTPTGPKKIEDIRMGDKVLSEGPTGKQSTSTVTKLENPVSNNMCSIQLIDNAFMMVTKGHPIFTKEGWKAIDVKAASQENGSIPVTNLNAGDYIKRDDGEWDRITRIACLDKTVQTYNISVDKNNTFYADKFLVHNKGCTCSGCYYPGDTCGEDLAAITSTSVTPTGPTSAQVDWTYGPGGYCRNGGSVFMFVGTNKNNIDNHCGLDATQTWSAAAGAPANVNGCYISRVNYVDWTCNDCWRGGRLVCCGFSGTLLNPISTGNILTPNTVYYFKVDSMYAGTGFVFCGNSTSTGTVSSCNVSPSGPISMSVGATQPLTTTINTSSFIANVTYSNNAIPPYVSFAPNPVTSPYSTIMTAIRQSFPASTQVTSTVKLTSGESINCTGSTVTTTAPLTANPWWQVKDADVATNGDLKSTVPGINVFGLNGPGGFPGIPSYGGTTNLTGARISSTMWLVASPITSLKIYNYQFFINQVLSGTTFNIINQGDNVASKLTDLAAVADTNGYYWFRYDGNSATNSNQPLTIPAVNIGSRKAILFVDSANANITGNINLTYGSGLFMLIVGQNAGGTGGTIQISPSVGGGGAANLEGLYVSDSNFVDGTLQPGTNDSKLWVRGSVVANGSVSLQRNIGGTASVTNPSELFEYAPDQVMLIPKVLTTRHINWKEVAP